MTGLLQLIRNKKLINPTFPVGVGTERGTVTISSMRQEKSRIENCKLDAVIMAKAIFAEDAVAEKVICNFTAPKTASRQEIWVITVTREHVVRLAKGVCNLDEFLSSISFGRQVPKREDFVKKLSQPVHKLRKERLGSITLQTNELASQLSSLALQ